MSTVAKRLEEAHEHLLQLYTSIPILTPCLEKIKTNQAEFVALNNRLRQLQETVSTGQYRSDKARKQLDSVFTINKTECERAYRQEISELKAVEDERRACLRQRDSVVTVKYQLHKERATLLEETRQLKKLNESVFDRSKDEVANADFPEELYWQLELKEYDFKITEVHRQLSKYHTALSNLARAANLSEAALVALLGYPDAAYKVWRVEYALKASQKMRLYLRVELSLSNAYSNEDVAREACPSIVPSLTTPIKPSTVQFYFEPISKKQGIRPFSKERELRVYIAQLRTAHRAAEMLVAQETERLHAMQSYRESIIPLLAKIRRHVFQNSCLGGYRIEGWEDEQGRSLLGQEADVLVRGGIHEVGIPTLTRPLFPSSSSQNVPTLQRPNPLAAVESNVTSSTNTSGSGNSSSGTADTELDEETMNTGSRERRSNGRGTDQEHNDQETAIDPNRPVVVHGGRVVVSAGRAPLSTLSPSNVLGSEVLMQVDRQRQAKLEKKSNIKSTGKESRFSRNRSRSRPGRDADLYGAGIDPQQGGSQASNGLSALGSLIMNNADNTNRTAGSGARQGEQQHQQVEREGRKKNSRRLFGFARSRHNSGIGSTSSSSSEDAGGPSTSSSGVPRVFQLGRNSRSSIDVTSVDAHLDSNNSTGVSRIGHRRNVPSISVSNHDNGGIDSSQQQQRQQQQHLLRRTFFENSSLVQLPTWTSNSSSDTSSPPSSSGSALTRPRVMSMDEYIGIGPVAERHDLAGPFEGTQGSAPLIPSYEEHQQHQAVDPELLHMMNSSVTYEGLSSLAEQDEDADGVHGGMSTDLYSRTQGQRRLEPGLISLPTSRVRSRSLSPHSFAGIHGSNTAGHGEHTAVRPWYQQHHYSLSDQSPDGSAMSMHVPPPDYAVQPPQYTA
ncbi:hypothetical protein EDD11_004686 [Mortierella claussenii]|nr:hypothetical protein EDD11_004686 [Mortierella claussenii]